MAETWTARRIVAGVDGTAASDAALGWAVRESRLRHAVLHLVLAHDQNRLRRAPYAPASPVADAYAEAAMLLAAAECAAARELPRESIVAELADGPPARVLLDRADGADLLVLGTTGPAGNEADHLHHAVGPVARACVRRAPCPVVLVAPRRPATSALPRQRDMTLRRGTRTQLQRTPT